jgi:hypothetical protein
MLLLFAFCAYAVVIVAVGKSVVIPKAPIITSAATIEYYSYSYSYSPYTNETCMINLKSWFDIFFFHLILPCSSPTRPPPPFGWAKAVVVVPAIGPIAAAVVEATRARPMLAYINGLVVKVLVVVILVSNQSNLLAKALWKLISVDVTYINENNTNNNDMLAKIHYPYVLFPTDVH